MRGATLILGLIILVVGPRWQVRCQDDASVAVEAVRRLKGSDLGTNPALRTAVERVVERVRGQPAMAELIIDFDLRNRIPDLVEFIQAQPEAEVTVSALRYLSGVDLKRIEALLAEPGVPAAVVDAVGRSGVEGWVGALEAILISSGRPDTQREAAARAMMGSEAGSKALLKAVEKAGIPGSLRELALSGLRSARWSEVRGQAAAMAGGGRGEGGKLPSKAELLALRGDPGRGAQVFRRPSAACLTCHQVGREGADFGPRLTEIGAKLGKDALYDALVDPSAGISFGFEAWLLTLRDGDEVLGLIASETDREIVLKVQGGQVFRHRKEDVVRREKQVQSVMPSGLLEGMTAQEVADLLAYLAALKPAEARGTGD